MTTKNYSQLTTLSDVQATDLVATWRSSPLKTITALILKNYCQSGTLLADGSIPLTGALQAYVGAVGSPGITFDGDEDTGFYRKSANVMGVVAGAVEVGTFSSAGFTGNVVGNLTGGVTSSAVTITGGTITGITDLAVADGGTGASTAAAARTNLGAAASGANADITSLASLSTPLSVAQGGTAGATAAAARTALGVAIGTDVQAYNTNLAAIAGLTSAADKLAYFTGSGAAAVTAFTSFGRSLVDDADAATARSTLGLGTMSTQAASGVAITGGAISGITDLAVADGGTGSSTASGARTNLGAAASGTNTDITSLNGLSVPGSTALTVISGNIIVGNTGWTDTQFFRGSLQCTITAAATATGPVEIVNGSTTNGTAVELRLRPDSGGSNYCTVRATNNGAGGHSIVLSSFNSSAAQVALTIFPSKAVQFNGYGAGTLVTDGSGVISASSDERLKTIVGDFADYLPADLPGETRAIAAFRAVGHAKVYRWKDEDDRIARHLEGLPALLAERDRRPDEEAQRAALVQMQRRALEKPTDEEGEKALALFDAEEEAELRRQRDKMRVLEELIGEAERSAQLADIDGLNTLYPGLTAQQSQRGNPIAVKPRPDGLLNLLDRGEQALQREVIFDLLDMVAGLRAQVAELPGA